MLAAHRLDTCTDRVLQQCSLTDLKYLLIKFGCIDRLVHPDKCSHPQAKDASAVANQAYDTLLNSVKKTLYDRCCNRGNPYALGTVMLINGSKDHVKLHEAS